MIEQDEIDARAAEEETIAKEAGACCTDPTPDIDDGVCGTTPEDPPGYPGEPECVYYCSSCGTEMSASAHAALLADLQGVRSRIDRIRAEHRGR